MALKGKNQIKFLNYYSHYLIILYILFFIVTPSSGISDTISFGQSISQNQTIISNGSIFELGFFSPGNSTNYYIGIWYKNISVRTVVWVANRDKPIPFSSLANSSLVLSNGTLNLYTGSLTSTNIIWTTSSMTTDDESNVTEAVLLDTGNLVLRGGSRVIWQSFDYPTDTCLPGGKVGFDKTNNRPIILTSWRNIEDPASGIYSLGTDGPELFMRRNLTTRYARSGIWNGLNFTFSPATGPYSTLYSYNYVTNDEFDYFTYSFNHSTPTRVMMNSRGFMQTFIWLEQSQEWLLYVSDPVDACGVYETCGPFGVCNAESSPICSCLPGFVPRIQREWDSGDFSSGCVRTTPLQCNEGEKRFERVSNILPADSQSLAVGSPEICEFACSINCSCNAYSFAANGGGCLLWTGDLLDLQNRTNRRDLFLKLDGVEILDNNNSQNKKILRMAIPISVALLLVILGCVLCFLRLRRRKLKQTESQQNYQDLLLLNFDNNSESRTHIINTKLGEEQKVIELPMFSFSSISNVTDNFSAANRVGEGGFGPVYKGNLLNGQSVAVKRLSKMSVQGLEELRNEAILIAKLQHKNLVRLLGCCTEKDEKILIYEYMPNRSLDSFLFDPNKKELLNWSSRVKIIDGIAQGLLYLHEYSRLRIVHRDLKASNILLDGDMNPKISDFGIARIFGGNELQANTNRIVGTYGYMSPEYAINGHFSVKSDVFAFGVLLLEILSGKKNSGFHYLDFPSLLGYAWTLWENKRVVELFDQILQIPGSSCMPLRYIVVGLLCVQESPDDRPTISDVLAMLSNEQTTLATPKRPAFTAGKTVLFAGSDRSCSINVLTTSAMEAR